MGFGVVLFDNATRIKPVMCLDMLCLLWGRACLVVSDLDRYVVIRMLPDYVLNICTSVYIRRWEIRPYLHGTSLP
jgi:hypothetical protein